MAELVLDPALLELGKGLTHILQGSWGWGVVLCKEEGMVSGSTLAPELGQEQFVQSWYRGQQERGRQGPGDHLAAPGTPSRH